MKIRGQIVGITAPAANLNQTDSGRADYIHGREVIFAHHENRDNPHGVTRQQLGAAAENHSHTVAEIGAITEEAVRAMILEELGVIEHGTY